MNNEYYVYAYLDPRNPGDYTCDNFKFEYEPFYIGKGKNSRYKNLLNTQRVKYENKHLKNKINIIRKEGLKPIVTKVAEGLFEYESFAIEMFLINGFGRADLNTGILCNLTAGGDGCSGRVISSKQIEKHMRTWTSPFADKKLEDVVGVKRGGELRKKASERMRKNNPMKNKKVAEKVHQKQKENWEDKKYRLKHVQVYRTDEFRRKQSISKLGSKNPNYGKIFGDNNPSRRPEVRAKLSIANSGENNGMYGKANPWARELAMRKRKEYLIISPDNIGVITKDLRGFCCENGLSKGGMNAVSNGYYSQHRGGWVCLKTEDVLMV